MPTYSNANVSRPRQARDDRANTAALFTSSSCDDLRRSPRVSSGLPAFGMAAESLVRFQPETQLPIQGAQRSDQNT